MGNEFTTITTAIDNRGYSICKVTGLGKLSTETFVDMFDEYFESPSYICTYDNKIYNKYCEINNIPHYIKVSNYNKILELNNYIDLDLENKEKLLNNLYNNQSINRIENKGRLSYLEFSKLKSKFNLGLSRINELHSEIKKYINVEMTNVSTKYLEDYIGFFNYLRNYKVRNGHFPNNKKDRDNIFNEILLGKVNYTINKIKSTIFNLPKATGRYINMLKEYTNKIKLLSNNLKFKFNSEDGIESFNLRDILLNLILYKFYKLCKDYKISKYKKLARWSLASILLKNKDIKENIFKVICMNRVDVVND